MNVLITGFNSFGNLSINPSEMIVEELKDWAKKISSIQIQTEILRTEFLFAGNRICELIQKFNPEIIILLGVAQGDRAIRLEQIAMNYNYAKSPDNAGEVFLEEKIVSNGSKLYYSTLPIDRMRNGIENCNIPVRVSRNAGGYVCNHVFYKAMYEIERLGLDVKCGFIHIPLMTEYINQVDPNLASLPKEVVLKAIKECIRVTVLENLNSESGEII